MVTRAMLDARRFQATAFYLTALIGGLLLATVPACDEEDEGDYTPEQSQRLCEDAVDKLGECFNVDVTFDPCDGMRADDILAMSCTEIATDLASSKSDDQDDWFCVSFPKVCEACQSDPDSCQ